MSPSQKEQSHSEKIVCPICKKVVHEIDLPNKEGVITDSIYYESDILIVDSDVTIHRKFEHMHDEQKNVLAEPHDIIAVCTTHFDETGECSSFEIVELLDPEGGG
jgi:hypothetical protein